jgi:uncharacterized phage protein (TIGR02218 family)
MTFAAYEMSEASGEPILLYDFSVGTTHWRYTSADRVIAYNGAQWTPLPISRTAPVQSSDIRRQQMTVTMPRDAAIAGIFAEHAPSADVLLIITSLHYTDPDGQGLVDWVGRVVNPSWKGSECEIVCEPAYAGVRTQGLRRRWGLHCPHVIYGPACGLSKAAYKVAATINSVSGLTVTSGDFTLAAGLSFMGGFIEWDSGLGYLERRSINAQTDTTLTLDYGSSQLVPGLAVAAYPGCDRTQHNCQLYNNNLNFGGQPYIPTKNPMDGSLSTPVY